MTASRLLGFDLTNTTDGTRRTVARFTCSECWRTLDVTVGTKLVPDVVANTAKNKGWTVQPFRKTGTYCPTCAGPSRKPKNDPDSELRKVIPMVAPTPIKAATSADEMRAIRLTNAWPSAVTWTNTLTTALGPIWTACRISA